jgi:hypothetical protein
MTLVPILVEFVHPSGKVVKGELDDLMIMIAQVRWRLRRGH